MIAIKRVRYILILLLPVFVSCRPQSPISCVQSGDLLFTALPYDYHADNDKEAADIRTSVAALRCQGCRITDTLNIIHVSILDMVGDSLYVIDATLARGVQRYPWADYVKSITLRDGSLPTFFVCRLNDASNADLFVHNACRFIGQPYDTAFEPDNGAMYCSELVRESYVTAQGDTLFAQEPIDCRAPYGAIPPYWRKIFAKLGASPQGMGTWPNNMIYAHCIHLIDAELPYAPPAIRERFAMQRDTLVRGLGPKLHTRITPRNITVLDAYYYSIQTDDEETVESNAIYTFLNHSKDDPLYYGIFAEDSLQRLFNAERRFCTPVDANVEHGTIEPSITDITGFWVYVQPMGETFVYDNQWDFIPAMHVLPDRVEFLTMDGVWVNNISAFHTHIDGSFELQLDEEPIDPFTGTFIPIDTVHHVYRVANAPQEIFIAPAVQKGETPFEVVEYACRIPEILDSYFSHN